MTAAKPKKSKRGRPENPKYQETIRIDAPPEAVAKAIMQKAPEARNRIALSQEQQASLTGGVG